jgi:glycosyltransferase involved in cell wall biosynthesis
LNGTQPAGQAPHRLCFLSDSPHFYPPFTAGGSIGQCYALASALREQGVELRIVARQGPDDAGGADRLVGNIPFSYLGPAGEYRGRGWPALAPSVVFVARAFFFLLRTRKSYDIILVSGFRLLAVPAGLAARIAGKKCIVRIEDSNDLTLTLTPQSSAKMGSIGRWAIGFCLRLIYWTAFRLADRIVAFSPQIRARLLQMGAHRSRVVELPNGIDAAKFTPVSDAAKHDLRVRLGLPTDKIIFIFTGRISPEKGVPRLLELWRRLNIARDDVCLILLGSGDSSYDGCETEARRFIQTHGLERSVLAPGSVTNVPEYLQASDLFIFLSLRENFSLSILEALCTGLPSLLTRVGGAPMGPHETGWGELVDIDAPIDLVLEKILGLLAIRTQWPAMAITSRRIVADGYTIQAVRDRYLRLFDELQSRTQSTVAG